MILLDTHVALWALMGRDRVGSRARRLVDDADVRYLSAVTHLEVELKRELGRLRAPADIAQRFADVGLTPLPFEARHAHAITRFPALQGHDPFDRMLLAQADVDRLTFLTADSVLLGLDLPWVIDATI